VIRPSSEGVAVFFLALRARIGGHHAVDRRQRSRSTESNETAAEKHSHHGSVEIAPERNMCKVEAFPAAAP
jgi:hypothetical protein